MSDFATYTLLTQVACTFSMFGLIWFVQIVHYPLFARVGAQEFQRYEIDHQRLTTLVVVPLMLGELASAVLLVWLRPEGVSSGLVYAGLGVLIAIWLVTFTIQVPQHAALTQSYDAVTQQRLVLGNWLRTVGWTLRGGLVLWMLGQVMRT